MNAATFSIPNRWQDGAYQIKTYIENYARAVGQPLKANIAGELDSGLILIADIGNLAPQQREAADNALHNLNSLLNRPKGEPWKARSDAETELEQQLAQIDKLFSGKRINPPNSVSKWLLPRGRMDKGKYCLMSLGTLCALALISFVISPFIESKSETIAFFASIVAFLMFIGWAWFGLVLTAKRFHDLNSSGWFAPLVFVPVAWVILCVLSGTKGPNKYGPEPY